ncbi:MAG: tyrosine-type recombinase/integrase [Treponemataceae bacterium]
MSLSVSVFQKKKSSKKSSKLDWYYEIRQKDGKTIQRIAKFENGKLAQTREEAKKILQQKVKEIIVKKTTIESVAKEMYLPHSSHVLRLENLNRPLQRQTMQHCRYFIEHILQEFGNEKLEDFDIRKVYNFLFLQKEKSYSWKNQILFRFNDIYDEAQWQGLKVEKPTFKKFVAQPKQKKLFSREEIAIFLQEDNFIKKEHFLLFKLKYLCGLRMGEVRAVQKKQIIFDKRILIVDGFFNPYNEKTAWNKAGNLINPKIRIAIIPENFIKDLEKFCFTKKDDDFIFSDKKGNPFNQRNMQRVFDIAVGKAGLTKTAGLTPHSLRFSYVTHMIEKVDASVVQSIVGHSSRAMTEYYNRPTIEAAINKIEPSKALVSDALNF